MPRWGREGDWGLEKCMRSMRKDSIDFCKAKGVHRHHLGIAPRLCKVSVNPRRNPEILEFGMGHGNLTRQTRQIHPVRDGHAGMPDERRVDLGHGP